MSSDQSIISDHSVMKKILSSVLYMMLWSIHILGGGGERLRNERIHKVKDVNKVKTGMDRIKKHSCSSLCGVTSEACFGCTCSVFTKFHEMCKY